VRIKVYSTLLAIIYHLHLSGTMSALFILLVTLALNHFTIIDSSSVKALSGSREEQQRRDKAVVALVMRDGASDSCSPLSHPIAYLKGSLCGGN
jgi:hypothetical protein